MSLVADKSNGRLALAICASLAINAVVWSAASSIVNRHVHVLPPRITFERVVIEKNKIIRRIVPKKPKPIKKPAEKPKPVVHHDQKLPPPPPPPTHNNVVTSKAKPTAASPSFTAQAGGQAPVGKPVEQQGPATIVPPPAPPPVVEQPKPTPPPPVAPPPPAPPVEQPKPTPPPVVEKKPDPPKPKGPTKDAEAADMINPEIPDSLKSDNLRAFVHVKVNVHPDGSFDVVLRTSSHNPEVDKLVLDALKRWKWKPALEDGEPVESTKLFKFEFEVK